MKSDRLLSTIALLGALLAVLYSGAAFAGACLCLKSNGTNITEFSCKNVEGNNECGQLCGDGGWHGSEFYADETCSSLHRKIKRQEITVPVPPLNIIRDVIQVVDSGTGVVIREIVVVPNGMDGDEDDVNPTMNASTSTSTGSTGSPGPGLQPVLRPGESARRLVEATAQFIGGEDTFDVPDALGGGRHTTSAFGGSFKLRLLQRVQNPNLYDVTVLEASTVTGNMVINGFNSGLITGTLNPRISSQGLYNAETGSFTVSFSQLLVSDIAPDEEMLTFTTYSGTCTDCLEGGQFILHGNSLYISPIE